MTESLPVAVTEDERDIFFGIINRFIGFYTRDSQRETRNDMKKEYPFVPMDTRQAFDQIRLAHACLVDSAGLKEPYSFMDVGCGIGNVLLLAEQIGFEVFGIEKDPYPCAVGRKLMGDECVQQGDIWEFDGYEQFDVIYYFRPFHEGETQRRFEKMIEDRLKPGGVLIANRKMSDQILGDERFVRLDEGMPVWRKETGDNLDP